MWETKSHTFHSFIVLKINLFHEINVENQLRKFTVLKVWECGTFLHTSL